MSTARGGNPQDDASLLGRTVGRYRLDASLGTGGMGDVFLGWDLRLEKSVAVKALRRDLVAEPRSRERFVREARYACRVHHPFVCSVLDVVEDQEELFLVMEHVDGRRLDEVVDDEHPTVDRVRDLAIEVAEALGAIHGAGLVHRDLKPSNVMVTGDGHVKVMDFGVARLSVPMRSPDGSDATMTETGYGVGTIAYMSPEQIKGNKVDGRSDLFSLGILLYRAITGEHPFERGSPYATASAILHDPPGGGQEPVTLSTAGSTRQIVLRLLEKDPELRYSSAEELLLDLRAAKEGLRLSPLPKRAPRFGAATVWTAAALAVAAGVAGVSGYRSCVAARQMSPLVVVLPFGPTDGIGSDRGAMMADLVAAGLADTGRVRRISPDHLEEILASQPGSAVPTDLPRRVADATGAKWVVSGRIYKVGSGSEAAIDIHERGGAPDRSVRIAAVGPSGLVDALLGRLIPQLSLDAPAPGKAPAHVLSDELFDRYASGVQAYREYRYGAAIAAFEAVLSEEARFAPARRWLTLALERAGYEARALESARLLEGLLQDPSSAIPETEADWSRAAIATVRSRNADGIAAMRALLSRRPDDVDGMRQLARLLIATGQATEAVTWIDRALEFEPGFVALRLAKVGALQALRKFDEAGKLLESAAKDVPDSAMTVRATLEENRGGLRQAEGRLDDARNHFLASAALLQRAERPLAAAIARGNALQIELLQGKLPDATSAIGPLLSLARSEGCYRFVIGQVTALGATCFQNGQLPEAQSHFRDALGLAHEIGNEELSIDPATNLASLLSITGRFGEARGLAEEAARVARSRGEPDRERPALVIRADALMAEGRLAEATTAFETLAAAEGTAAAEGATWARLGASEAREIQGEFAAAERLAVRAGSDASSGSRAIQVGYASSRRGETLARAGFLNEASKVAKAARNDGTAASLPDLALRLDWVEALSAVYAPDPASIDRLTELARRAHELGASEVEHSVLIALAESSCRRGDAAAALSPAQSVLDATTARFAHRVRARVALARALAMSGNSERATAEARRAFDEASGAGMPLECAVAASILARARKAPDAELVAMGTSALQGLEKVDADLNSIRIGERVPRWDLADARATLSSRRTSR